jgi:hypothetical protein
MTLPCELMLVKIGYSTDVSTRTTTGIPAFALHPGCGSESRRIRWKSFDGSVCVRTPSRARFQLLLEQDRGLFVVEHHDHESFPRAIRCGMRR